MLAKFSALANFPSDYTSETIPGGMHAYLIEAFHYDPDYSPALVVDYAIDSS
jgi:hypothetical protein